MMTSAWNVTAPSVPATAIQTLGMIPMSLLAVPTTSPQTPVPPSPLREQLFLTPRASVATAMLPTTPPAAGIAPKGELLRVPKVCISTLPSLSSVEGTLRIMDAEVRFDVDGHTLITVPTKGIFSASSKNRGSTQLFVVTKGFRLLIFSFPQQPESRKAVSAVLREQLARHPSSFLPWGIPPPLPPQPPEWYYDLSASYRRMGALEAGRWRLTRCNDDFSLCESYPRVLCIPAAVDDETLRAASQYRTQGRVPVLSYYHRPTRRAICRSAQPMPGITNAEDKNDQRLVQCIGDGVCIIDLRPFVNAVGNIVRGAGYEDVRQYEGSTISFHGIPNIHRMSELYRQVLTAVTEPPGPAEKEAEVVREAHAAWVDALSQILTAAERVTEVIDRDVADCLVHCSDGWDRTPQVVSVAQVLLDGHSRTVRGFLELIDKDWVQGGHQFESRLGISARSTDRETSPVFLQFLDIVHQIIVQHPTFFEFTTRLLIHIADVMYECRHVTFAFDSPKELHKSIAAHAPSPPPCAFRELLSRGDYVDSAYDAGTADTVMAPCVAVPGLTPWREYFHRYGKYAVRTKAKQGMQRRGSAVSSGPTVTISLPSPPTTREATSQTDMVLADVPARHESRTLANAQRMCMSADMLQRLDEWD